jgi:hypothetical protein
MRMTDSPPDATITRSGLPPPTSRGGWTWSLPPDLLAEAVRRLRIASLLYAVGYFLAALLQPVLFSDVRARFFAQPFRWIMPTLSIGGALAVAAAAWHPRLPPRTKVGIGLAFEVLGSFGIAAIQYQAIASPIRYVDLGTWDFGLSLYALGCVAYWLLTGTAVFTGRTAIETMMMHVHRAPERPSSRTAVPVPPDLEQLVMACLEKDPNARPATADELGEALAAVRLPGEWTAARARAWWAAHAPPVTGRYPRPTGPDSRG